MPPGNSIAMSAEKCSLTSAAAAANDVMISWSSVLTTSCSSRRAPRTSSTCASSSLCRSSSWRQLLERERVDRAERDELSLELVGVLSERGIGGRLGLGEADELFGPCVEVAVDVLGERLGAQVDLVGLEVEGSGAVAHRIEPLLGGVAVLAQLLELLAAGADRVDLVLVVVAQRVEDLVESLLLGVDQLFETAERRALGLEAFPSCGGAGALLGVAGESSLDLGVALGEDAAALGDAGDADLELLAASADLLAALLELAPGVQGLGQVRERPDELRLLGGDLGEALLGLEDGGAGVVELGGQACLLLGRRARPRRAWPRARRRGGRLHARPRCGRRVPSTTRCGPRSTRPWRARPRRRLLRPAAAPLRPRPW